MTNPTPVPMLPGRAAAPLDTTTCLLCYRYCELADGETGWCKARGNRGGSVVALEYGQVSCVVRQIRGYQVDPFLTYKPGATSLFLGGLRCTAGCTFCMSTQLVHRPEAVRWAAPADTPVSPGDTWYGHKATLKPVTAVLTALQLGCQHVEFGINEPTVTAEWTLATASVAKECGLDVVVETNGFTTPHVIEQLFAQVVDAVDVGVKGSADPEFYARQMRSAGAVPHVLDSLLSWRRAGTHVIVGDLIAPPHTQSDAQFEDAARRFYGWLAEHLGPVTDVLVTGIMRPGPARPGDGAAAQYLVRSAAEGDRYDERQERAVELAAAEGLPYAHRKIAGGQEITCHSCGGVLLHFRERCSQGWHQVWPAAERYDPCVMPQAYCPWWGHDQYVTDSRCDHCGAQVPIVALSEDNLDDAREVVADSVRRAGLD